VNESVSLGLRHEDRRRHILGAAFSPPDESFDAKHLLAGPIDDRLVFDVEFLPLNGEVKIPFQAVRRHDRGTARAAGCRSDLAGQDRQGPLERHRQRVERAGIGDFALASRHLLEARAALATSTAPIFRLIDLREWASAPQASTSPAFACCLSWAQASGACSV